MLKISDLVNKVEAFRFEYDGFVLEGEWFKYKTTSPSYAKKLEEGVPEIAEDLSETERLKASKERFSALEKKLFQALAESIKSWNVVDEHGEPLQPSADLFEQLPEPFTSAFAGFFKKRREAERDPDKNPPLPDSSNI